jgi:5-methylthioribose kinase
VPNTPTLENSIEETKVFIVDWEFSQFGNRSLDLGQMVSDLYKRQYFADFNSGVCFI